MNRKPTKRGSTNMFILIVLVASIIAAIVGGIIGFYVGTRFTVPTYEFKLIGNKEISVGMNSFYEEQGATLKYAGIDYSKNIEITYYNEGEKVENVDTSTLTTYYAVYTYEDNELDLSLTRKIEVVVCDEIEFHFMMLGNENAGDSIFVKAGETDILIDAGSRTNSAPTIIEYVDKYCLDKKLEYVIATHADQDHIAAFSSTKSITGIFDYYEVETIIDFGQTNKNTQTYNNYVEKRDEEVSLGATHYKASQLFGDDKKHSNVFEIASGITMTILEHDYYYTKHDDENNHSVVTLFSQLDNHYLLTGDLEKEGEESLVESNPNLPEVKLFKAGHHGSYTSSNDVLLSVIKPEIVTVTCVAGTDEYTDNKDNQFPSQNMINNVKKYTDKIYVTTMTDGADSFMPMNGNIIVSSKGYNVEVNCSNNNTILKDTDWFKENRVW